MPVLSGRRNHDSSKHGSCQCADKQRHRRHYWYVIFPWHQVERSASRAVQGGNCHGLGEHSFLSTLMPSLRSTPTILSPYPSHETTLPTFNGTRSISSPHEISLNRKVAHRSKDQDHDPQGNVRYANRLPESKHASRYLIVVVASVVVAEE